MPYEIARDYIEQHGHFSIDFKNKIYELKLVIHRNDKPITYTYSSHSEEKNINNAITMVMNRIFKTRGKNETI